MSRLQVSPECSGARGSSMIKLKIDSLQLRVNRAAGSLSSVKKNHLRSESPFAF
jgi:hypothetical protein